MGTVILLPLLVSASSSSRISASFKPRAPPVRCCATPTNLARSGGVCCPSAVEAFAMFDANNDGFVDRDELLQTFAAVGEQLTPEELSLRMKEADLNGDGFIDFPEFVAMIERTEPVEGDYGFRTIGYYGSDVGDPSTPANFVRSATENFKREFAAIRRAYRYDDASTFERGASTPSNIGGLVSVVDEWLEEAGAPLFEPIKPSLAAFPRASCLLLQKKLNELTLSNARVADREEKRIAATRRALEALGGKKSKSKEVRELAEQQTPWFVMVPYKVLCLCLDFAFDGRPIQRFWFLETVARIPYFSYISMLHLYESIGWWRNAPEVRKLHFAQEWNEMHHLLIMEALGGDRRWLDRFLARHSAVIYYWVLCFLFVLSPNFAYNFSELIEAHAVDTYDEFMQANEELLKKMPAPPIAVKYYGESEEYSMRRTMRTTPTSEDEPRVAPKSLYEVFANIADDEGQHVSTMRSCQDSACDLPRLYPSSSIVYVGTTATSAGNGEVEQEMAAMSEEMAAMSEEMAAMSVATDGDASGAATWASSALDTLRRARTRKE